MQSLISIEYTKPLVSIQVLFLKYVTEKHVREGCVCVVEELEGISPTALPHPRQEIQRVITDH